MERRYLLKYAAHMIFFSRSEDTQHLLKMKWIFKTVQSCSISLLFCQKNVGYTCTEYCDLFWRLCYSIWRLASFSSSLYMYPLRAEVAGHCLWLLGFSYRYTMCVPLRFAIEIFLWACVAPKWKKKPNPKLPPSNSSDKYFQRSSPAPLSH